jgi:hypothetical protein
MKRYFCMLLSFTACLLVAGCGRSGGQPRNAVTVKVKTDVIAAKSEKELMDALKPGATKKDDGAMPGMPPGGPGGPAPRQ